MLLDHINCKIKLNKMLKKLKDGSYLYSAKLDKRENKVYALALNDECNRILCCKYENKDTLYAVDINYEMTDQPIEGVVFERYATTFDI